MVRSGYLIALLAVVSAVLFFPALGAMELTDPDESFYAETAKEMYSAGEWITPTIFGKPQFEKPVFYYWLVLLSYKMFGVNEFAARFPSAVFGIAGVIGVFLMGRLFFSPLSGFLSGIVMATSIFYLAFSRACVTDIVLAVFVLYTFVFFIMGWTGGKRYPYLLASVMAAGAVLTKGPIGLFITGAVISICIVAGRKIERIKKIPFIPGIFIFLALVLPWYITVTRIHGALFLDEFFGLHNVVRFLKPEHRIGSSPFFYIPVLFGGFAPWSLFLPAGVWYMYAHKSEGKVQTPGARVFLLTWFLVVFIFFSVSRTKLVTYIFPLFPVMALVVGDIWEKCISSGGRDISLRKWMRLSFYVLCSTGLLGGVAGCLFIKSEHPAVFGITAVTALICVLGMFVSLILLIKGKDGLSFISFSLTLTVCVLISVYLIIPDIGKLESSRTLALLYKELAQQGEEIGGENDRRRGIEFYADKTNVVDVHPYNELKDFVSRGERVWCIIHRKHYEQLAAEKKDIKFEVARGTGDYVLVTNMPLTGLKDTGDK